MKTEIRHKVEFYSPGTFVSEVSVRQIGEWNTRVAVQLAGEITERHGARPFGFRFITETVVSGIADGSGGEMPETSKRINRSGTHFINGKILTLANVEAREPGSTLASNMRSNQIAAVVETSNSYRHVSEFREGDCIVDADGTVLLTAGAKGPAK